MLHICYALSDHDGHYSKFTGASIASIFENTKCPITIHLLHDDTLTPDNHEKFVTLTKRYAQVIHFYNIGQLAKNLWNDLLNTFHNIKHSGHLNIATMYRLLATDILPLSVERLLYLDADIIVTMDLSALCNEPFYETGEENGVAAVVDEPLQDHPEWSRLCQSGFFSLKDYFNAGVLLMDMQKLRKDYPNFEIIRKGFSFLDCYPTDFADQDILNFLFQKRYRQLPKKYNIRVVEERFKGQNDTEQKGIYHYAGWAFTLDTENDAYSRLFFQYLMITPWFDEKFIGRLTALTRERYTTKLFDYLLQIANLFSRKNRVFISQPTAETKIRKAFNIQPNEEYLVYNSGPLNLNIDLSRRDKVYIFCASNYEDIKSLLEQAGCVEGEDFLDGFRLLAANRILKLETAQRKIQDLEMDDYSIIRNT